MLELSILELSWRAMDVIFIITCVLQNEILVVVLLLLFFFIKMKNISLLYNNYMVKYIKILHFIMKTLDDKIRI